MNIKTSRSIRKIYSLFLSLGVDLRKILALKNLPKYFLHYRTFIKNGGSVDSVDPILYDYDEQAGVAKGHYFHQDLIVANSIHRLNPARHIDIGSRIDGFVAHVASFRKIEVLDVRSLEKIAHENISFIRADLMSGNLSQVSKADSISCLHAIEHFGLGRYGDTVDVNGHIKGFNNLIKMLSDDGTLYISFPIGVNNKVIFNKHRIFHPHDIFTWALNRNEIKLVNFDYVDDFGDLHCDVDLYGQSLEVVYGCGIYTFKKINAD